MDDYKKVLEDLKSVEFDIRLKVTGEYLVALLSVCSQIAASTEFLFA